MSASVALSNIRLKYMVEEADEECGELDPPFMSSSIWFVAIGGHSLRMSSQSRSPDIHVQAWPERGRTFTRAARTRMGAMIETRTIAVTEVDLQIFLAGTELRMYFSRACIGSTHYLVMQSQTAFLEAL